VAVTYPAYVETDDRPRRRRGRRLLGGTIVLIIVLAGLLFAADRASAAFAERAIADQVRKEAAKQNVQTSSPDVTVGGFPFLTQVLDERYKSIKIVMRDVRGSVDGNTLSLPRLDVDARNVRASIQTLRSGQGEVVADTVHGTATLTYASVAELMNRPGIQLSEQNGKLAIKAPLDVLGQQLTVTGTGQLTVADGKVRIKFETLSADGMPAIPAAQALVNAYAKQISINVALPDLPFRLQVQDVKPLPDGLAVTATANDVPINARG
jgi:LmeA-like phospholipid-binding